jgi:competence CoiA-like predicted nuclease
MPLRGMNAKTKESFYSTEFKSRNELLLKHPEIICPISGVGMFPRFRKGFIPHFVRKEILYDWENESYSHIQGKIKIFNELQQSYNSYHNKSDYSIFMEYPIYENDQIKRIIDVAVLFQGKPIIANEIQLSKITLETFLERIKDYEKQGIDNYWYFGKEAYCPDIEQYCLHNYGYLCLLNISKHEYKHGGTTSYTESAFYE